MFRFDGELDILQKNIFWYQNLQLPELLQSFVNPQHRKVQKSYGNRASSLSCYFVKFFFKISDILEQHCLLALQYERARRRKLEILLYK